MPTSRPTDTKTRAAPHSASPSAHDGVGPKSKDAFVVQNDFYRVQKDSTEIFLGMLPKT